MIYTSLALLSLATILILIKPIEARIVCAEDTRIELEYFPIKIILSNFDDKSGQKRSRKSIGARGIIRLVTRAISLCGTRVSALKIALPSVNAADAYTAVGRGYSLLFPALTLLNAVGGGLDIADGAISLEPRPMSVEGGEYYLDLLLCAPLFSLIRLLILYLFEHIRYRRKKKKWKMR